MALAGLDFGVAGVADGDVVATEVGVRAGGLVSAADMAEHSSPPFVFCPAPRALHASEAERVS